ncbi:MAG: hypothetical protein Q8876_05995 [Bacillota bacterium]|nr:hypothetical protein [Bacillota bacterium]
MVGSDAAALSGYGYACATPFAIASHMADPYLTNNEKWGLSGMEVGLAIVGIGVTALTPVGWGVGIGIGITVGVSLLSCGISAVATEYFEEKNGKDG